MISAVLKFLIEHLTSRGIGRAGANISSF